MFKQIFTAELSLLTEDATLIEIYWNEIEKHYSKTNHHYHNLSHLDNILLSLLPIKHVISDWQTIIFSIAYHDIIYNVMNNNNEEKSAEFARKRLSALSIPIHQVDKCCKQILATKGHDNSNDDDTNIFTDADISILGTDEENYKRYADFIRKEYKIYPDFLYNPGRIKVLKHFLEMKKIYKTDFFYSKYEDQARINIEYEIRQL